MDMVYSLIPILHHKKQEIPFLCIRVETTNTSSSFIQGVGVTASALWVLPMYLCVYVCLVI